MTLAVERSIFSKLVYDVDNRYINVWLKDVSGGSDAFILVISDTSNDKESDTEIELYLTRDDLQNFIDRLANAAYQQLMKHVHRLAMDGHEELAKYLRDVMLRTPLEKAAKQALNALKSVQQLRPNDETNEAINALRSALKEKNA